jgi:hypothetical protein
MTAPADTDDLVEEDEEAPGEAPGRGLTRGVKLAGLALGAALITYMYSAGIAPRIPGIPEILGLMAGFAVVMVMVLAVATALSWLLRWHHRDIAAWGYTRGRRAASWGYGHGRHHGRRLLGGLTAWASARWRARQSGGPDDDPDGDPDGEEPDPGRPGERGNPPARPGPGPESPADVPPGSAEEPSYSWGPEASPAGWPARDLADADARARHASTGGKPYVVTEYPPGGGPGRTVATYVKGKPVQPATEGSIMTETASPTAGAATRTSGRKVPPVMRAVIGWIDDFEPENDADLHEFLLQLAAGLHDIGASLNDLYEMCTSPGIRIGRGGMSATHAAADAIAEASGGVAGASKALQAYYAGVSEEVAGGIELPKDGDFITGDGAVG